jgi:serine/threonine-protein kinase RsbT
MALLYDVVAETLCRFLSPVNAHAILKQVVTECGRSPQTLAQGDLGVLASRLERAAMLFLDATKRRSLRAEIDEMARRASPGAAAPAPKEYTVEIRAERDITEARLLARQVCLGLNAKSLEIQKVATVVSELARNIVSYTRGGQIEIKAESGGRRALLIRATDHGPGIRNLDEILSGQYRSKTGLGLGIVGTKRLSDRFTITSDATGTRIEAEIRL